jgi:hypothetical protein
MVGILIGENKGDNIVDRLAGLEDACERILSPLMFPDLPQYFPSSNK